MFRLLASGLCAALPLLATAQFVAPEPEDLVIYHLMIDRFDDGDASNNDANPRANYAPTNSRGFHGGDLEGVRRRLPYIRGLGVNAIWLSPLLENAYDYHGYGTFNWYNVEPNFGTLEKLRQLIDEANDLGIAVYFDMVAGHCANLIDSTDQGFPGYLPPPEEYNLRWRTNLRYPAPFNQLRFFHGHGNIGSFDVIPDQEIGELQGLDDLKTETAEVQQLMTDVWKYWLRETNVSGFRIDTVKHIDQGFWNAFLPALREEAAALGRENYFTFGEIYGGDDNYMALYVGNLTGEPYRMDAALDFQYYYMSNGTFAHASWSPAHLLYRLAWREYNLGPAHHYRMPNFIDNHDVRRFLSLAQDNPAGGVAEQLRRLELALTIMYMLPGPPVVYYGTEQGFNGGNDPNNREDMFAGRFEQGPSVGDNFDPTTPLYRLTARLGDLRRWLAPLRRGGMWIHAAAPDGPGPAAFSRVHEGNEVLVVFNNSTTAFEMEAIQTNHLAGVRLVNALNPSETLDVDAEGRVAARMVGGHAAEVWVTPDQLPPVSPDVLRFIPASGENAVELELGAVQIQFATPMEPAATAEAISINPAVPYDIEWDQSFQTATLTLAASLVPLTQYVVTVSESAESADGVPLGATLEARWTTRREAPVLPPLPPVTDLKSSLQSLTVDGELADWPTPALEQMAANTGVALNEGVFLWRDALGDDVGAGEYTYPTNQNFSGTEADFDFVAVAWDDDHLHLAIQPVGINAAADFFTPYFGMAITTGPGGRVSSLGFDQATGSAGVAELLVREDIAPDFELVYTGPRGASLANAAGGLVAIPEGAHSQATGAVELRVAWADLGGRPDEIALVIYSGLETFGSLREVQANTGQWDPGGGVAGATDPDVFDLIGAPTPGLQTGDLAGFDATFMSTVMHSVVRLRLIPQPHPEQWLFF